MALAKAPAVVTAIPQVVVVAAPTESLLVGALVLLFGATPEGPSLVVESTDEEILGEEEGVKVEELRFRFTMFEQSGHGYQSQAGRYGQPGDERLLVYQPMTFLAVRQSATIRHTASLPVDIVSSASADALDAISTASRHNEAGTADVTTTWAATPDLNLSFRYGAHVEENFRSGFGGPAIDYSFAEDNTVLGANLLYVYDQFDPITPGGKDPGSEHRSTVSGNLSLTQVLSPTTIASFNYGATYQVGVLQQTWNSVALEGSTARLAEIFPRRRWRHAMSAMIAQHIPATHSTIKGSYRYYFDSFDLEAHTVEAFAFQYLAPEVYVRGSYRYYTQDGVEFFMLEAPAGIAIDTPRTSDSDLSAFRAHELGIKLVVLLPPFGPIFDGSESVDVSYMRYFRDNDLEVDFVSFSYGGRF
jgi:hypothetical protein